MSGLSVIPAIRDLTTETEIYTTTCPVAAPYLMMSHIRQRFLQKDIIPRLSVKSKSLMARVSPKLRVAEAADETEAEELINLAHSPTSESGRKMRPTQVAS